MASPRTSPRTDWKNPTVTTVEPSTPRVLFATPPTSVADRNIGIAVDLSNESAYAVQWAVQNYLRSGDAVVLLHVQPTNAHYGADWGATHKSLENVESQRKLQDDFDVFTNKKATEIAQPLVDAKIPFKIHIVKDHDTKERLCLEVERLVLSTLILGSRGVGNSEETLGSVSDYAVHHCCCPVVVVRFPDDKDGEDEKANENGDELHTVPEVAEDVGNDGEEAVEEEDYDDEVAEEAYHDSIYIGMHLFD